MLFFVSCLHYHFTYVEYRVCALVNYTGWFVRSECWQFDPKAHSRGLGRLKHLLDVWFFYQHLFWPFFCSSKDFFTELLHFSNENSQPLFGISLYVQKTAFQAQNGLSLGKIVRFLKKQTNVADNFAPHFGFCDFPIISSGFISHAPPLCSHQKVEGNT